MTNLPTEINAAAVKNGSAEKHTPMMQQYFPPMKTLGEEVKPTLKATLLTSQASNR